MINIFPKRVFNKHPRGRILGAVKRDGHTLNVCDSWGLFSFMIFYFLFKYCEIEIEIEMWGEGEKKIKIKNRNELYNGRRINFRWKKMYRQGSICVLMTILKSRKYKTSLC